MAGVVDTMRARIKATCVGDKCYSLPHNFHYRCFGIKAVKRQRMKKLGGRRLDVISESKARKRKEDCTEPINLDTHSENSREVDTHLRLSVSYNDNLHVDVGCIMITTPLIHVVHGASLSFSVSRTGNVNEVPQGFDHA